MPTASYSRRYRDLTYHDTSKPLGKGGYLPQTTRPKTRVSEDEYQFQRVAKDESNRSYCQPSSNVPRVYDSKRIRESRWAKREEKPRDAQRKYYQPSSNVPRVDDSKPIRESRWAKREEKSQDEQRECYQPSSNVPQVDNSKRIPESTWAKLEEKSQDEQTKFVKKWESQFQREPVNIWNVKRGDHLCCPGSMRGIKDYEHHMLCSDVSDNHIEVIEYGSSFGFSASSQSSATKNPLAFGQVKTTTYTYEQLVSKKTKIIKWPKELERYTTDVVIKRAEKQAKKRERLYHALDNNCESFVFRCKCGLNISLQVKPWYRKTWEVTKAVGSAAFHTAGKHLAEATVSSLLPKLAANVSDEIAGSISSSLSPIGFGVGAAIDIGFAIHDIWKDKKKADQGVITKTQFRKNAVKTSFKSAGRIGGGIIGSTLGSAFGPVGTVLGGIGGMVVGHFASSAVASGVNYVAPKIASVAKSAFNTCVSYAKKGYQKVKGFFKSIFSW